MQGYARSACLSTCDSPSSLLQLAGARKAQGPETAEALDATGSHREASQLPTAGHALQATVESPGHDRPGSEVLSAVRALDIRSPSLRP